MAGDKEATRSEMIAAIVFYSLCSSMMLVVNKLAMRSYPVAGAVNLMQLTSCSIFVFAIGSLGLAKTDPVRWEMVKPYGIYVCAFAAGIYSNMKALGATNVETIIVFRACTPITVAVIEWAFMDRELPSQKSSLALAVIVGGAYTYVSMDAEFSMTGSGAMFWIASWYFLLCFQMTYGKVLLQNVKLDTVWGPVLYTNLLSIPPTIMLAVILGDFQKMETAEASENANLWVSLSCVVGIAIGYSGWMCRDMVSATTYTLVGVINKLLSVLVSVTFINTDASWASLAALGVCLVAGTQYSQAPRRSETTMPK